MNAPTGGCSIGVVGTGRAGSSFATVLERHSWRVETLAHSQVGGRTLGDLAAAVDVVLLCVPDDVIGEVASVIPHEALDDDVVLAHCSGATGLEPLHPARRRASIHPLVSLNGTNPESLIGAWFAIDGDPLVAEIADSLEGRTIRVGDRDRSLYHAAAVVASNHLVALFAQVEAIAGSIGVPMEAFIDLAVGTLDNVRDLGPASALTGPVSRGDWATVRRHVRELVEHDLGDELAAYRALASRAAVLAGRDPSSIDDEEPEDNEAPPPLRGGSDGDASGSRRNT